MVQAQQERQQASIMSQLRSVTLAYNAGSRIDLPHDFTAFYTGVGSVTLDNLLLKDVTSLAVQDKHPMWVEPKIRTRVTYDGIADTKEGLTFGKIILQPYDTEEALEVIITGKRIIPEIEALHARRKFQLFSPEIVRVMMTNGPKVYRDIDFVHCKSGGLSIAFETPLALPKDATAAYNALPARS